MSDPRTRKLLLALLIVVVMVNLPLVQSAWTGAKVEREGIDVDARLVGSDVLGSDDDPQYWVSYRLPDDIDPQRRAWPVQLERSAWEQARAAGEVEVRVLPDEPVAARVAGETTRRTGLWITLVVDALLVTLVVLFWRRRLRRDGGADDEASSAS